MRENIMVIGFVLLLLASALLGCSISSPITGGATAKIPEQNSTFSAPELLDTQSASVSARVLVHPLPAH